MIKPALLGTIIWTTSVSGFAFAQEANPIESEPPASVEERMGLSSTPKEPLPDLAYGAYQRGYYLTAFDLALPRAKSGDPAAQTLIAEIYDKGLGVAKNPKEATAWYGIAAKSGNREAQFSYAVKLLEGSHVERDEKQATELLQKAADAGHYTAKFNYAQQILKQNPGSSGFKKAYKYFQQAADAGIADAFYTLAVYHRKGLGGIAADTKKAKNWLIRAARSGHDTAQIELAISLANGTAMEKDERSAFAWFQQAASTGNPIAQNRMAKMLVHGIGTKSDKIEAAKWHILASRAGKGDLWLDEFMQSLSAEDKVKAFAAANRWPG